MNEQYKNDHDRFDALTVDYIDGTLSASDSKWFEEHMQSCADCRERLEAMRFMLSETAVLDEEPPEGFTEFIMTGIDREDTRRRSARITFLRPLISAAACFVLIALGAIIINAQNTKSFDSALSETSEGGNSLSIPAEPQAFDACADEASGKDSDYDESVECVPDSAEAYDIKNECIDDAESFAYCASISDELLCCVAMNSTNAFSAIIVVSDPEAVENFDEPIVLDGVTICEFDRETAFEMLLNCEFGEDAYTVESNQPAMANYKKDSDIVIAVAVTE